MRPHDAAFATVPILSTIDRALLRGRYMAAAARIESPNIDRLAAEGVRFTQAYAGGPVCTSSRAVLMTGLHTGHTPARDNVPHYPTYLRDSDVTVAEVLKQAGYRCGGVGKWSLGDASTVGRATNQGFDTWFGYLNQDHAHYYFTEYLDDDEVRFGLRGNAESHKHYSHDLLTKRALKFIREAKGSERPFFLYAAYTLPHFSSKDEDGKQHKATGHTMRPHRQQHSNSTATAQQQDTQCGPNAAQCGLLHDV